jgi:hypothetical protein
VAPLMQLKIVDDIGKEVTNKEIGTALGMVTIDVTGFNSGLYHFGLYNAGIMEHQQTIVIIH